MVDIAFKKKFLENFMAIKQTTSEILENGSRRRAQGQKRRA